MSDYQWILPRISVGAHLNDYDVPQLQAERVGYIINAGAQHPFADSGFETLFLNTPDDGQSKYDLMLNIVAPWFKERWWKDPSLKFNIHCDAGVNRGPSFTMFVLMLLGLSASAAFKAITTARPITMAGLAYREDAMKAAEDLGFMVR